MENLQKSIDFLNAYNSIIKANGYCDTKALTKLSKEFQVSETIVFYAEKAGFFPKVEHKKIGGRLRYIRAPFQFEFSKSDVNTILEIKCELAKNKRDKSLTKELYLLRKVFTEYKSLCEYSKANNAERIGEFVLTKMNLNL